MWRWTTCIFVVLGRVPPRCRTFGRRVSMACDPKDPAATPPPGDLVDVGGYRPHLWCTGDGAPAVILDSGLGGSSVAGASSNRRSRDSRVSAPTTGQVWATAIPGRRRGPHAGSRARWPNSSRAAGLTAPSCWSGPPSRVSTPACSLPITPSRAAGLVLVDASHEDQAHDVPPAWRGSFLCCRRSGSFDCSVCRSANQWNRSRRQYSSSRGRRVIAQPGPGPLRTRSCTFGRARRKSGVLAARSRSLSSSPPVTEEPTRTGESCNTIRRRCQNEVVWSSPNGPVMSSRWANQRSLWTRFGESWRQSDATMSSFATRLRTTDTNFVRESALAELVFRALVIEAGDRVRDPVLTRRPATPGGPGGAPRLAWTRSVSAMRSFTWMATG